MIACFALSGDTYNNRLPDPVLQQVEHFGEPSTTVNDSFPSSFALLGSDYSSRSNTLVTATSGGYDDGSTDCGPAFIGLPQDVQEIAYDYPVEFCWNNLENTTADLIFTKLMKPLEFKNGKETTYYFKWWSTVFRCSRGACKFAEQDDTSCGNDRWERGIRS